MLTGQVRKCERRLPILTFCSQKVLQLEDFIQVVFWGGMFNNMASVQ